MADQKMTNEPTLEAICVKRRITTEELKSKMITQEGACCLEPHCEDWEDIAPMLKFKDTQITDIKEDYSNNRRGQRIAFLKEAGRRGLTYFRILHSLCKKQRGGRADDAIVDLVKERIIGNGNRGPVCGLHEANQKKYLVSGIPTVSLNCRSVGRHTMTRSRPSFLSHTHLLEFLRADP